MSWALDSDGVPADGRLMSYDQDLANRIRELLSAERGIDEKTMFGGLAFLVDGHLAVAASGKGGLMVRVPPDETEQLLARAHVSPMVMAGRETRGWLRVAADGVKTKRQLEGLGTPRRRLRAQPAAEAVRLPGEFASSRVRRRWWRFPLRGYRGISAPPTPAQGNGVVMSTSSTFVIVGAGLAGAKAAEALRDNDFERPRDPHRHRGAAAL